MPNLKINSKRKSHKTKEKTMTMVIDNQEIYTDDRNSINNAIYMYVSIPF